MTGPFEIDALVDVVIPSTVVRLTRLKPLLATKVGMRIIMLTGPPSPPGVAAGVRRGIEIATFLSEKAVRSFPMNPPPAVTPRRPDTEGS